MSRLPSRRDFRQEGRRREEEGNIVTGRGGKAQRTGPVDIMVAMVATVWFSTLLVMDGVLAAF